MLPRKVHTEFSKYMYGYEFKEVHKWMDETVEVKDCDHETDRHDLEITPDRAYEEFKSKVPEEARDSIKNAVRSHIALDFFAKVRKRGQLKPRIPVTKSEKKSKEEIGNKPEKRVERVLEKLGSPVNIAKLYQYATLEKQEAKGVLGMLAEEGKIHLVVLEGVRGRGGRCTLVGDDLRKTLQYAKRKVNSKEQVTVCRTKDEVLEGW